MTKRLLTGLQTSGSLHLGNLLGCIKPTSILIENYESFVFLADLHSITVPQDKGEIAQSSKEIVAAFLACGINSDKANIFLQSSVPQHAELSWILSCYASMGWMDRMTQYKEKSGKYKERASLGLYSYPVLMAADILLYNADIVPVGEDQKQHIELARDIAQNFNRRTDAEILKMPEPIISKEISRIMSLKDGTAKMSKSDPSDLSRINLTDNADQIAKKFRKAKTDSIPNITFDKENRPDIANLLSIYSAMSDKKIEDIVQQYEGKGFADFKKDLSELAVEFISPITEKINHYLADEAYLKEVLVNGAEKAKIESQKTLDNVKEAIGFYKI